MEGVGCTEVHSVVCLAVTPRTNEMTNSTTAFFFNYPVAICTSSTETTDSTTCTRTPPTRMFNSGEVRLNGLIVSPKEMRAVSAFVAQEDVAPGVLTVREVGRVSVG